MGNRRATGRSPRIGYIARRWRGHDSAGFGERDLEDPDVEIDLAQEFRIIDNILAAIGDEPGLGLLAGFSVRLPLLGGLGIAMSGCSTVREMVDLQRPMPQPNSILRKQYEQLCAETVERRRSRAGLSGQVRTLLVRYGRSVDQSAVAADLHMSVRTLRRRLAEEGTTFRELAGETTGILAEGLLSAGFTVDTVAGKLGYTSVSAFAAAFRDWKGQTPGQFARSNQVAAHRRLTRSLCRHPGDHYPAGARAL